MASGCVKWFDSKKGFGFIEAAELERDVFVHHSGIAGDGYRHLKEGDKVDFDIEETDKGPQAVNVRLTGDSAQQDPVQEDSAQVDSAQEDPAQVDSAQSDSSATDAES
ncbi:MAG: cold shock domain-containing protein [Planctomycetes bacterium]|nr:cold shock domain-containing protein [Planctomycetota bacterium]MCH8969739.1 cold shock domain-containing protein [Planctomycetota bacterium]